MYTDISEEHDASISGLQIQVDTEVIERRNMLIMLEVSKNTGQSELWNGMEYRPFR